MGNVYLKKCNEYNLEKIKPIIKEYFEKHLNSKIKAGSKVLIKPNLVRAISKESGAVTHPELLAAVIEVLYELKAVVTIAESPGGTYNYNRLKSVYKTTGIFDLSIKYGCILNFDLSTEYIKNEDAKILKNIKVIKPVTECDFLINIAKLKTHMMMTYTGAVKNMFGIIPGIEKADYHMRFYEYNEFADSIIDIYNSRRPDLNIIDAIESMEGKGPTAGKKRNTEFIVISQDGYEADYVATKVVNIDTNKVPIMKRAIDRNYLKTDQVKVVGDQINDLLIKDFLLADENIGIKGYLYNKIFIKHVAKRIKPLPYINKKRCKNCGVCVNSCPVKTIEKSEKYPIIHHEQCIRCFCCHELCPHVAINIKRIKFKR